MRLCPCGAVAQQVAVELLLAFQSAVVGVEGYHVAGKHVAHQDAEDGDEVAGTEKVLYPQHDADEVQPDAHHAAQEPGRDGQQQHPAFQLRACQRRVRGDQYHGYHPQEVNPRVVPQEQVIQVDADAEQLHNHACRADDGGAQQSGLELPEVEQRKEQQQQSDAQAEV